MSPSLRRVTRLMQLGGRPVLAGAFGALTIAFSAILVRLAKESPETAAFFRCAYAVPVLALLAAWERRRYGPRSSRERRLGVIAGAFFAADLVLWHAAIGDLGAGLSTVVVNLQLVFVGLVAWVVLRERPDNRVIAAVPVVLVGVVLISGAVGGSAYGEHPVRGVVFGVLTALTYTGFLLVLRHGNVDLRRPAGALFDATWSAALFILAIGAVTGNLDLKPSWPAHGWLLTLARGAQVLGGFLIYVTQPRLPAVVTSLLLMMQPVGSVVLGVALLSERPSAAQLLGVLVILGGVAFATLGGRARARQAVPQRG
jgi:drug/metabolite transporter (DMT)-like permease